MFKTKSKNILTGISLLLAAALYTGCDNQPKETADKPEKPAKTAEEHHAFHALGTLADIRDGVAPEPLKKLKGIKVNEVENAQLNLAYRNATVGGIPVRLRTYELQAIEGDEVIVGPLIETDPTSQVNIKVLNQLPESMDPQYWFYQAWGQLPRARQQEILQYVEASGTIGPDLAQLLSEAQKSSLWGQPLLDYANNPATPSSDSSNAMTYFNQFAPGWEVDDLTNAPVTQLAENLCENRPGFDDTIAIVSFECKSKNLVVAC